MASFVIGKEHGDANLSKNFLFPIRSGSADRLSVWWVTQQTPVPLTLRSCMFSRL